MITVDGIQAQQEAIKRVVNARSHKFIRRLSVAYPEQEGDLFSRIRVSTMICVAEYCDMTTQTLLSKVNKYFNSLIRTSRTKADINCQSGWVDAINRSPFLKVITLRNECTPEDTQRFCRIIKNDGFPELTDINFVYVGDDTIKSILTALSTKISRSLRLNIINSEFSAGIIISVYDLTQRICYAFAEASTSLCHVLGRLRLVTSDQEGLESFFKVVDLSNFSRLSLIDLAGCPLHRRGTELFIRSVWPEGVSPADLPPVKILRLSDTQMTNSGMLSMSLVMRREAFPNLEELDISSNKISHSGMTLLAEALGAYSCPNLKKLNITDNFISVGNMVSLFGVLTMGACPLLEELEFAHTGIGASDLEGLIEFVCSPFAENLKRLNISNNPQITDALGKFFEALRDGNAHNLRVLFVEGVSISLGEVKEMIGWLLSGKASHLKALILKSNLLDGECFRLLLQTLVDIRCPRLTVVDFSSNLIGDFVENDWLHLISLDGEETIIEQIDFSFNPFTDNDMRLLLMFLSRFSRLERISRVSFTTNNISSETFNYFFRAFPEGPSSLSYLSIDSCSIVGAGSSFYSFLCSESFCNLTTLSLRDCGLSSDDLWKLMDGFDRGMCNKLSILRLDGNGEIDNRFVRRFLQTYGRPNTLSNLSRLDLGYTQIDAEGVMLFYHFFEENPNSKLYSLDLSSICLQSDERSELKEMLKNVWTGHCSF